MQGKLQQKGVRKSVLFPSDYSPVIFSTVLVAVSVARLCSYNVQSWNKATIKLIFSFSPLQTKIASCSKPSTSWSAFPEQKSAFFSLKKGQRYYLEALHVQDAGKSHVMIGVKMQETRYVNSQTGSAVNEKQEIHVNSIKHPEIQVSEKEENFLVYFRFNEN